MCTCIQRQRKREGVDINKQLQIHREIIYEKKVAFSNGKFKGNLLRLPDYC